MRFQRLHNDPVHDVAWVILNDYAFEEILQGEAAIEPKYAPQVCKGIVFQINDLQAIVTLYPLQIRSDCRPDQHSGMI